MASWYSTNFIFNNTSSALYNLHIYNFNDGGFTNGVGSSELELFTQRVNRKSKVYTLGRIQSPVLEFPLIFGSSVNLPAYIRSAIGKWLFGQNNYCKLQILQSDLADCWFNCYFTKNKPIYIGNLAFAFEAIAVCDSPYAYSGPKKVTYGAKSYISESKIINVNSADVDYVYPNISFTLSNIGTGISIINTTDSLTRSFTFTDLTPNYTVTVDNDRQIITSNDSLMPYPISKFNYNWLRFVPGQNVLSLSGNLISASITWNEPRKVGA